MSIPTKEFESVRIEIDLENERLERARVALALAKGGAK